MPLAPLSMVSSSTAGMASQIWEPDWLVYTKGVVFVSDDFHCVNSFFFAKALCKHFNAYDFNNMAYS
jgi:hypothetical protein